MVGHRCHLKSYMLSPYEHFVLKIFIFEARICKSKAKKKSSFTMIFIFINFAFTPFKEF